MNITLIRHGKTAGNLEKRYIGTTDEPLCDEGRGELSLFEGRCDTLFSSPMKRCLQTAEILFPDMAPVVIDDLRECSFGDFEGKNYSELNGDPDYQVWIDSGGMIGFPNGETRPQFISRTVEGFISAVRTAEEKGAHDIVFAVHGGTIMAVLSALSIPESDYYDFMCPNGGGYSCRYENGTITNITEYRR